MTETFVEEVSTLRRPTFIETEVRTDTVTRRRLASTTSRSVHDILENTRSPTDGLPPTTYTYAHSVSYMPVTENGTYNVPVMARRDLHADSHSLNYSRNSTALSSPSRFVSNVRSSLKNTCSEIRDRLTPQRNPLQTPKKPQTTTTKKTVSQSEGFLKKFFKKLFHVPWWIWLPLLLGLVLYFFPHTLCKPFEHYPESKIYQQCRTFEDYTRNVSKKVGEDFSHSFRYADKAKAIVADRYDDFVQLLKRWFGGVKKPVDNALDSAKDFCDAGMNKVNQLIEEVKREREKFLGPKHALKPEQESQLQEVIRRQTKAESLNFAFS